MQGHCIYNVDYSLQEPYPILWGISWSVPLWLPLQIVNICWTVFSRVSFELIFAVSRIIMPLVIELMKFSSSLLSLPMVQMLISMLISLMPILMVRGTWSDGFCISGWSKWHPNPGLLGGRNTRSITELESYGLSVNLVGPGLVGEENSSPRLSAKMKKLLVWMEWWWKFRSQSLSLMLKLPVIMIVLFRLTIFWLRNWRAVWLLSE